MKILVKDLKHIYLVLDLSHKEMVLIDYYFIKKTLNHGKYLIKVSDILYFNSIKQFVV